MELMISPTVSFELYSFIRDSIVRHFFFIISPDIEVNKNNRNT